MKEEEAMFINMDIIQENIKENKTSMNINKIK